MSQVIDVCEGDSDDNGERPNTAYIPSLPLSRKRPRDKETRNENEPGNKTATHSTHFVVDLDLELADEVKVSPDAHVADHRESHEGIAADADAAAAASHPINSDSDQTSPDDRSTNNEYSQKFSTSKRPSNASGRGNGRSLLPGKTV
jgi:hypothetical protein